MAAYPSVRAELLDLQAAGKDVSRTFRSRWPRYGERRFPDALLKVFLTASAQARAERHYKQLIAKGFSANLSDLARDLEERDRRDRERAAAPCVPAGDAHDFIALS